MDGGRTDSLYTTVIAPSWPRLSHHSGKRNASVSRSSTFREIPSRNGSEAWATSSTRQHASGRSVTNAFPRHLREADAWRVFLVVPRLPVARPQVASAAPGRPIADPGRIADPQARATRLFLPPASVLGHLFSGRSGRVRRDHPAGPAGATLRPTPTQHRATYVFNATANGTYEVSSLCGQQRLDAERSPIADAGGEQFAVPRRPTLSASFCFFFPVLSRTIRRCAGGRRGRRRRGWVGGCGANARAALSGPPRSPFHHFTN